MQSIVSQILFAERAPVRSLQASETKVNSQASAFRDLKTKLLALNTAVSTLSDKDTAAAKTASSSDITVLTAAGSGSANVGDFSVVVSQLATTDTFGSASFTSDTAAILTGSFDLKVGSDAAVTITVDSSNNTLTGLRDAINASAADAVASIVQDGSNYKLAIISKASGTAESITLSNFTNPSQQTELNLARTVTLQDASLTFNGLSITSGSNSVKDAIQGVTLTLLKAGSSQVSVSADTTKITDAINSFIGAYNTTNSFFNAQFTFNSTTKKAGVLSGDGTLQRIQSELQSNVGGGLTGLSTSLTNLKEAGINLANDGSLSLDTTVLEKALKDDATAVANLFLTTAKFSDARASLVSTSSKTQAGTYPIFITTAPEAGEITGTAVVGGGGLSTAGTVTVTYNSTEYTTSLTQFQTITSIVSSINAVLVAAKVPVRASDSGGKLKISTQEKGLAEQVSVRSSASITADLGISTTNQTDAGVDVAGTINGNTASGSGATLLAAKGGNEEGLAVSINATPAEVGAGLALGNATVTVGFAEQIERTTKDNTTTTTGTIDLVLTSLDSRIRDIQDNITTIEDRLVRRQQLLTDQLSRADNALRELSDKIAALSGQLAGLG